MKTFWRISLSCLVWTCTGMATAASATPYAFNESSNANAASNRAPVYPMYTDSSNSGLPDALTGNEGPVEFKKSRNNEVERTASNQPFMKEVGPGGREFSPNGGSIQSATDYRFSSASQAIPVEEWYGNHIRGLREQAQWQGHGHHHRNRNRNFQGGGFQSASGLNNNIDFVNNANPNLNNYNSNNNNGNNNNNNNNGNNNIGAAIADFRANRFNKAGLGNNNFNNNNNNNSYNNFNNNNLSSNSFNNNNFNGNSNGNNKRNRKRKEPDLTVDVKQPDRVADNPQVDGDGVRHFSNGKHLDLSKMSLDQAIGATNAAGDDPFPNTNNNRNSSNIYNAGNRLSSGNAISNAPPLTVDNSFVSSSTNRRHLPYQAK
jgi:hypothetical protein